MSAIAGFSAQNYSAIQTMLNKLRHWAPDRENIYHHDHVSLGSLELFNTPEAHLAPQPHIHNNLVIVANCRIDNREELARDFNLSDINKLADIEYIGLAYEKWGNKCVDHLYGDFAFVIWDEQRKKIFGARDHIGIKTLYYCIVNGVLVFSSEIKGVLSYPDLIPEHNEQYFAHALSLVVLPVTDTPYHNVHQFPAGNYFEWENKTLKITKYWELGSRFSEIPQGKQAQEAEFNKILFETVNCRLRTASKVGAEVSGGLDSTGIAGIAMEILGKGSEFYSYCFGKALNAEGDDVNNKDDSHLVEEFCNRYGITKYLTVINENHCDFKQALHLLKHVYDDCEINGVPLAGASFLTDAKKNGVGVILSGHGGDHLATSISTAYYYPKACKKMYKALWEEIKLEYSFWPALTRMIYYSLKGLDANRFKRINIKTNQIFLGKTGLKSMLISKYHLDKLPSDRYKLHHQTNRLDRFKQTIGYSAMQKRAYHHDLTAKHFNAEYRFPLLDVRLLEYMISLPDETIAPKAKPRYLFAKAVEDYIPKDVPILKSKISSVPFMRAFTRNNKDSIIKEVKDIFSNTDFSVFFKAEKLNNMQNEDYCRLLNLALTYQKKNKNK